MWGWVMGRMTAGDKVENTREKSWSEVKRMMKQEQRRNVEEMDEKAAERRTARWNGGEEAKTQTNVWFLLRRHSGFLTKRERLHTQPFTTLHTSSNSEKQSFLSFKQSVCLSVSVFYTFKSTSRFRDEYFISSLGFVMGLVLAKVWGQKHTSCFLGFETNTPTKGDTSNVEVSKNCFVLSLNTSQLCSQATLLTQHWFRQEKIFHKS